jgi:nucleotide-binding universal stress UspA family protein
MLRKLKVPVLTVCHGNRLPMFSRILFVTDLSDSSKEGFRFAIELAHLTRSTLIVLHVVSEILLTYGGGAMADYVESQRLELARSRMASYVREAEGSGVRIETLLLEGRSVAEKVVDAVDESDADLVILTLEKRGLLERAFLGTTAERVIRDANAPVLSIPAGAAVDLMSSSSAKESTNPDLTSAT